MENGIALGLTAALCWGMADFLARGAVRAGGLLTMLLCMRLVGGVALLGAALAFGPLPAHVPSLLPAHVPSLMLAAKATGIGAILLLATVLYYRGLAIGTVALVSPIASSFAAITALLALAGGERPGAIQLAGMAVTLAGVALAAATRTRGPRRARTSPKPARHVWILPPGVPEALAATVLFGVGYYAIRFVVHDLGTAGTVLFIRGSDLALLGLFALAAPLASAVRARLARSAPRPQSPAQGRPLPAGDRLHIPSWVFWCYLVPTAVLDTGANVAYNIGVLDSRIAVVSVLSSLFAAVTVLLAWALLRERLARRQWLGVALILLGVALVSLPIPRVGIAARAATLPVTRARFGGVSLWTHRIEQNGVESAAIRY